MTPTSPELTERFRADFEALAAEYFAPRRAGALCLRGGAFGADEAFLVAVSGGPDSLALLLLAHAAFPGRVHAATVDHGLRPESASEASFVAGICKRIGIPHEILAVPRDTPSSSGNLQATARHDRYKLLNGLMRRSDLRCLLTAHHADDQAETLLMRLARGSGVGGLAGVRAGGTLPIEDKGAIVLRPLLGWHRAELAAIVSAAGIEAIQDPSNRDDRFDRARLRKRLAETDWLDPAPIARSAELLAAADEALDWAVSRHWRDRVECRDGLITYRPDGAPSEIVIRLLRDILKLLDGEPEPRGRELVRLAAALEAGEIATLAGVKCTGGAVWRFEPAPPRRSTA